MTDQNKESQMEELEVLEAIYDGDMKFKKVDDQTFQYKYGDEVDKTTVMIEIKWPTDYPNELPIFNLDTFYNNHLIPAAKTALLDALQTEAEANIGSQQTYTLFEWARDQFAIILEPYATQPEQRPNSAISISEKEKADAASGRVKVRKEQLSKSQKRREWDRTDNKGERLRGNDWVDVVKHLSQMGSKHESGDATSSTSDAPNAP